MVPHNSDTESDLERHGQVIKRCRATCPRIIAVRPQVATGARLLRGHCRWKTAFGATAFHRWFIIPPCTTAHQFLVLIIRTPLTDDFPRYAWFRGLQLTGGQTSDSFRTVQSVYSDTTMGICWFWMWKQPPADLKWLYRQIIMNQFTMFKNVDQ